MWNGDFVVILLEIIWDIYICIYIYNQQDDMRVSDGALPQNKTDD